MKLNLAIQCVSVWDFMPIEDEVSIYIEGVLYPYTSKKGGYKIITRDVPDEFSLRIHSVRFFPFCTVVKNLNKDKLVLCELIFSNPPLINTVFIELDPPSNVVLGYNFFRLEADIAKSIDNIQIKNPYRNNLEGRTFLLRDTQTEVEEFIHLGDSLNLFLTQYRTSNIKNAYNHLSSVLLPSFYVNENTSIKRIPISAPPSKASILIYKDGIRQFTKTI